MPTTGNAKFVVDFDHSSPGVYYDDQRGIVVFDFTVDDDLEHHNDD